MWLCVQSAVLLVIAYSVSGQTKPEADCLSNKDCPSDMLCAEFKCKNPCHLNICDSSGGGVCRVSNHIPMCACKGGFSGPLSGGSSKTGRKKYHLVLQRMTWMEGLVHCFSKDMRMATIESQDEQDRLVNFIKQSDQGEYKSESTHRKKWWIGGSDLQKRGVFMWTSSGKPIKYHNFPGGQPDNNIYASGEREHCMELPEEWNYRWNDFMCDHSQYVICEYFE